ncbi:hypothetical protein [Ottowia thiooxydans]|uniref:hypothetical protein n=1 Tax=Ottowia thiooxydans TaxID=219182 RepID=UPI00040B5952|nr:hypothetical protein [Ottowia thiooxydans]
MHAHPQFRLFVFRSALALSLAVSGAATSLAQMRGNPPSPPPEAFAACSGKVEGASVSLTMPDGKTLVGICRTLNGQLVAVPTERPGAGGPPPGPRS